MRPAPTTAKQTPPYVESSKRIQAGLSIMTNSLETTCLVARAVLEPLALLLMEELHLGGEAWETRQRCIQARSDSCADADGSGVARSYEFLEVARGTLDLAFSDRVSKFLLAYTWWQDIITPRDRTLELRSHSFALLSASMCGLAATVAFDHTRFSMI